MAIMKNMVFLVQTVQPMACLNFSLAVEKILPTLFKKNLKNKQAKPLSAWFMVTVLSKIQSAEFGNLLTLL